MRFIVPDRGAVPSGGDVYDARLAEALVMAGDAVDVVALPGAWPRPGPAERESFARALDGAPLSLVDGLVGSACPAEIDRAVDAGSRVALLVHLPLPAEVGLPADVAECLAALEARSVRAASLVVVTSRWAAGEVERRYGRGDVVVVEPGAERGTVAAGGDPSHLLVLGALTAVKNHAVLVPALAALREHPWRATFAGPEAAQPEVAAAVRAGLADAGLIDRVDVPGAVVGKELENLWHRTDLLLLPSLVETYGLVVTEALAHGIPAVVAAGTGAVEALAGGGAPRATDPLPGAVADPTDHAAWRNEIHAWLTDQEVRARWSASARARREHLRTWADAAEDLRRGLVPDP